MLPRNMHLWLPGLVGKSLGRAVPNSETVHVYFCLVDHYEPGWKGAGLQLQRERIAAWIQRYPEIASRHQDADGRPPQHTFFFPEEEYLPEHLDSLAVLRGKGWGDVEVHLHHDRDTPESLRNKLLAFTETLYNRHGLLRRDAAGRISYGFIHGNFALNNAFPGGRWCGVDDETTILMETGCYADYTMPCAPHPAQSRKVNSIYYTIPQRKRRAHDQGSDIEAGKCPPVGLMMIQGPLGLNWAWRKWGLVPRIDNADISWHYRPAGSRVRAWIGQYIHVAGAPDHTFVKVSTHGAQERNLEYLLNDGLDRLWTMLEHHCSPASRYRLHYVTAYDMYCKIKELESAQPDTREPTESAVKHR
jgi:hypothetical protein